MLVGVLVVLPIVALGEAGSASCAATSETSGPTLTDVLKVCAALVAIVGGVLSAVVPDASKTLRLIVAGLVVLGTGFSFVIDRQKDRDDDAHRLQLLACVQRIQEQALALQAQGVEARRDQRSIIAQQRATNAKTTSIIENLRTVEVASKETSTALAENVRVSRSNLIGTSRALANTNVLRHDTGLIVRQADGILTEVDDTVYPFKNIRYSWETRLNLASPELRAYGSFLHAQAKAIFAKHALTSKGLGPGDDVTGGTGMPFTSTFVRFGERRRLLIHVGSPLMPTGSALGAVLGYDVRVDIFKRQPAATLVDDYSKHSPDYGATLVPPYSGEIYDMMHASKAFPSESYRVFEVSYFPDNDDCYVEYYVNYPSNVDVNTDNSAVTIVGLPDLRGAHYIVRMASGTSDGSSRAVAMLNWIRIRIGSQELALPSDSFRYRSVPRGLPVLDFDQGKESRQRWGLSVYDYRFPEKFTDLKAAFATVRSDIDGRPLRTDSVTDGP